jgi:GT2 family glycosyltransferase
VDLLGRVLSTLEWLATNSRNQLSHIRDLADSARLVFAVDALQLSPCGTILKLEGWLVDPNREVNHLCLIRGRSVQWLDLGKAQYRHRGDLAEVLQRCGAAADLDAGLTFTLAYHQEEAVPLDPGESAELLVVLRNGDQFCLRRPMVSMSLDVPQFKELVNASISERCSVASHSNLRLIRETWSRRVQQRLQGPARHQQYGTLPKQAELSVVVPLYGRIDFMEYQLNWFNAWQRRLGSNTPRLQLIYVLDDPSLKAEFETLTKRCKSLYRVPFETVINSENLGFAGANNRGSLYATAPYLLLLNSDVLPANDHSIESMLRAMQQHPHRIGALGARLLFENGGIQHVGMEFVQEGELEGELGRVWLNDHPLKGVNVGYGERERLELREVEAVTAACMLIETERFRTLGGFDTHYVVGDFEDSDLCLKVRNMGMGVFIDLEACFYHLERQSVGYGEKVNTLKMKLVAINAMEHHQRWCSTIERLKISNAAGVQP